MLGALLLSTLGSAPGCVVAAAVGGMAESYKRGSTHAVAADYTGLRGKSFAVIVSSDRVLQGNFPTLLPRMTSRITERLASYTETGVTGFVPAIAILEFQFSHPDWVTRTYDQLCEEFGVERLIVVDMYEYRLNEPGNPYLWDGVAAARVGVVEADGPLRGEFSYSKEIQVHYPDKKGMGPQDVGQAQVQSQLEHRFVDRVTWLMYVHQEPYYPEY